MKNINIPPFYVGQKVVALKSSKSKHGYQVVKGLTYTVQDYFQCTGCKEWKIGIKEMPIVGNNIQCCMPAPINSFCCGPAKYFAPIIENFEAITFEKVLEQELSSVN